MKNSEIILQTDLTEEDIVKRMLEITMYLMHNDANYAEISYCDVNMRFEYTIKDGCIKIC